MGQFAENPEKMGKDGAENGGKWRFSEGPKRHFAVLGADGPGSQAAKLSDFTSVDSGCLQPPRGPPIRKRAPFFEPWARTDMGATRAI
jgi:hypothetical protein